ncbi:hypothetical protein DQE82_30110 [Micromonospora sp. LHW51205]|uniref:magnesium transporter MgtE N-terminal domain-containing protein n=1 Tax=Micromonospora sp. LHW51205 TaxID=2248752 RepID=UPI000E14E2A9|nr:helix-turn-helix domain-containing protein [Micromonospora sp. LHW51205]RBQ03872.1 hypothetical protein DQE82_30110 [Micromonospora sp. LHW51205]
MSENGKPGPGPSAQRPDPTSVETVAQLGYQLTLLRRSTPRASNEPGSALTLAELARRMDDKVPISTLGNAESGKILPSGENVYLIALACGLSQQEAGEWARARERAWQHRHRSPHRAAAAATEPASQLAVDPPSGQITEAEAEYHLLATMHPRRATARLNEMGVERTIQLLARLSPDDAHMIAVFTAMDPTRLAAALTDLRPDLARPLLDGIGPQKVMSLFNRMPVETIGELAAAMDPPRAAGMLAAIDPDQATRVLGAMEWIPAAAVLNEMTPDGAVVLNGLEPFEAAAALNEVNLQQAARLLTMMEKDRAASSLAHMRPDRVAMVLPLMEPDTVAGLLTIAGPDEAAALLAMMEQDLAAGLLDRAAQLLRAMRRQHAAPIPTATAWKQRVEALAVERRQAISRTL